MSCWEKQHSRPFLFPDIPQTEKDIFPEDVLIWSGRFPALDTPKHPVSFFSLNGLDCKASIVLLPLLASAGLIVPKIIWPSQAEGNSLQNNLYAIPGMKLTLTPDEMRSTLQSSGGLFTSAPESLRTHHDRISSSVKSEWQLFSLISLLTLNSLDAKSVVYDIKINDSLSCFDIKSARDSVLALKEYSERLGIKASYFLSYMHQPLGQALGPVLELIETLEILKGRGPHDIKKLVLELGAEILVLANKAASRIEAKSTLKDLILRGDPLNKIEEIIKAQGGNAKIVNDYSALPQADQRIPVRSSKTGFVARVKISRLIILKERLMRIHPGAGLVFQRNIGDPVKKGDILVELYFPVPRCPARLQEEIRNVILVADRPPAFFPFIAEKIRENF